MRCPSHPTTKPHAQVRYSEAQPGVLAAAAKLGGGKAQPALELVGYEGEVEAAVKYAFGSAFVCQVSPEQSRRWGCRGRGPDWMQTPVLNRLEGKGEPS